MSWEVKKLSEICKSIFAGGDVPKDRVSKFKTEKFNVPIYSNGEKNKGLYGFTDTARVLEPSITVSARGTIGYSEIRYEPFLPVVRLITLTPNTEKVELEFLKYIMKSIEFTNSGVAIPQLTVPMIKEYECTLPTVEEQKRIIEILDQAFAQIDQAKALAEQNLKNAREVFESALFNSFEIDLKNYESRNLENICEFENGDRGSNYPSKNKLVESGIPFVNAGHIDDGEIDFTAMNFITPDHYGLLSRGKFKAGDLLFCLRGSLGKFGEVPENTIGAIASSLVIVRPNEQLSSQYLMHYFRSHLCSKMIKKYAGGAAQPNLGAKDLKNFTIPFPSYDQQLKAVAKLDNVRATSLELIQIYQRKIQALDELKQSVLQKAFSGELTADLDEVA